MPAPRRRAVGARGRVAGAGCLVVVAALGACDSAAATRDTSVTVTDQGHPLTVATDQGTTAAAPTVLPPASPAGDAVTVAGVTVAHPTDLTAAPAVTAAGPSPSGLVVEDLVVGTGPAASPSGSVYIDYVGVLLADGRTFESSWADGGPKTYRTDALVPGMLLGIGGTSGVAPMHVGGRRVLVFPAELGYGNRAQGPIPAGSSLAFVVDLTGVG